MADVYILKWDREKDEYTIAQVEQDTEGFFYIPGMPWITATIRELWELIE